MSSEPLLLFKHRLVIGSDLRGLQRMSRTSFLQFLLQSLNFTLQERLQSHILSFLSLVFFHLSIYLLLQVIDHLMCLTYLFLHGDFLILDLVDFLVEFGVLDSWLM